MFYRKNNTRYTHNEKFQIKQITPKCGISYFSNSFNQEVFSPIHLQYTRVHKQSITSIVYKFMLYKMALLKLTYANIIRYDYNSIQNVSEKIRK